MPKAAGTTAPKKATAATAVAEPEPTLDLDETEDWFVGLEDVEDFINCVYYGREGSAKTTNAAHMANIDHPGKVLFINAEGGLKVVALRKRGVDVSKIVQWPDPRKHQRITHKGLDAIYRRVKADLERDPQSWIGVVIDSATEVHTAILDHVQEKRVMTIKRQGKDVDEDFVDISDYGTMSKMFRDLMRKFRDLPCHVVITALERRDVDKDTQKPQYGPAVTPGLQTDLLGYVDLVLMCKAADEDGPYRALTRANSRYRAKDRFDVTPRVMVEPRFDRLVGYLNGTLSEETDPFQDDLPGSAAPDAPKQDEADTDEDKTDESPDDSDKQ